MKRSVAVMSCLLLFAALAYAFTRVVAVRVPEQRATLEKLITDRTGLEVRFDNVRFAWDLDGTSAVFTRVELIDPKGGRVRVVAPELRVELDTWDFVRHSQFSFGHVTVKSPDIEIIAEPDESMVRAAINPRARQAQQPGLVREDEAALLRRHLAWAELMPIGRIEVEGARVHLLHRGERVPRHSFTLSQAVVSRSNRNFSAYGTLLLAQEVGQSLFVSAKLEGVGAGKASGDLRFIARRVFLQKLDLPGVTGRGTLDARLVLRDGHVDSASWQASARDVALSGGGPRFDHVSVNGKLTRQGSDVLLDLTDLQLARSARLERAPALSARVKFAPGSMVVAGGSVRAERLPFMAGQLIAGVLTPHLERSMPGMPADWSAAAGELQGVRFESAQSWTFDARIAGLELVRQSDQARLGGLAARVHMDARALTLQFDPSSEAVLRSNPGSTRPLTVGGELALLPAGAGAWRFKEFSVTSGPGSAVVNGNWNPGAPRAAALKFGLHALDRVFADELLVVLAADWPRPEGLADIEQGTITEGSLELMPREDGGVDWSRSSGKLALVGLSTSGQELPRLSGGQGSIQFARGGTSLVLESGDLEDLVIREARVDWPRRGEPRLRAQLEGELSSPLLRPVLESQGLERLSGHVVLEADARGEREMHEPRAWRVNARVSDATAPLGGGLPAVQGLKGNMRYSARQLRALTLEGEWLGGPVEVGMRRAGSRAPVAFAINGVADAAPLLRLLGQAQAAEQVTGQFAWTGSAQPAADGGVWQLSLASNLSGIESRLPEPFDKTRSRSVPVAAEIKVTREGVRAFEISSGRSLVSAEMKAGVTHARFDIQDVVGEFTRPADHERAAELKVARLDVERGHEVLAAAAALLPAGGTIAISVEDSSYAGRSLGPLRASLARQPDNLAFTFDSPAVAIHQLSGRGQCGAGGRCRVDFSADTAQLAVLLRGVNLPPEWPAARLHAKGSLEWPLDAQSELARSLGGHFDLRTESADAEHQMAARASVVDGEILLADVQGTGPEADQVFRGQGRIGLLAREYDLTVDYERLALAATAVPSPARARLARAWNAVRGSAARRGWTEPAEARRVQWHGTWQ